MGIRISKALGWGVVLPVDGFEQNVRMRYRLDISDYPKHLEQLAGDKLKTTPETINISSERFLIKERMKNSGEQTQTRFEDVVKVFDLNADEIALLVIPFSEVDTFYRHDDAIDYYEYHYEQPNPSYESTVKKLAINIFPWTGYMDKRTGKAISQDSIEMINLSKKLNDSGLDSQLSKLGFSSFAEFEDNLRPAVPTVIHRLVEYLDLFVDEEIALKLRPMLVTNWS